MKLALVKQFVTGQALARLDEKRYQGRSGWHTEECTNKKLLEMLRENLEQGDMIDVINLAGMIYVRNFLYEDA